MQKTRVFKSGNSKAVRLPKEFTVDASELYIRKIGSVIMLTEKNDLTVQLEDAITRFSHDFMSTGREQPELHERFLYVNDPVDEYSAQKPPSAGSSKDQATTASKTGKKSL